MINNNTHLLKILARKSPTQTSAENPAIRDRQYDYKKSTNPATKTLCRIPAEINVKCNNRPII